MWGGGVRGQLLLCRPYDPPWTRHMELLSNFQLRLVQQYVADGESGSSCIKDINYNQYRGIPL